MQHHWRRPACCAGLCIIQLGSPCLAAEVARPSEAVVPLAAADVAGPSEAVVPLAAAEVAGPSEAVVVLADGRSITGRIDAKTDEHTLWIRQSDVGVVLRSGFDWNRVDAVLRDGQSQDKRDILQTAAQLPMNVSEEATNFSEDAWAPLAALPEPTAPDALQSPSELIGIPEEHVFAEPASLQIGQVGLANWNRDAAIDGLEASLCVVDDFGRCVPVSGQLEISLVGMRQRVFGGAHLNRRQPAFVEIGRWSIPLRGPAPAGGEIWLRLPFTRVDPLDPTIADRAHLHMRLNVPGIGSFEAARIVDLY